MGQDRTIQFSAGVPSWDAIRTQLARVGEPAPLRMIDGLPAFPDETPADGWRELRVAAGGNMVTLRRTADSITCVVWGNADAALLAAFARVVWACAEAGGGSVVTATAALSPTEFAHLSDIRPA